MYPSNGSLELTCNFLITAKERVAVPMTTATHLETSLWNPPTLWNLKGFRVCLTDFSCGHDILGSILGLYSYRDSTPNDGESKGK